MTKEKNKMSEQSKEKSPKIEQERKNIMRETCQYLKQIREMLELTDLKKTA